MPHRENIFVKPNDQSQACLSFGMARKCRMKCNINIVKREQKMTDFLGHSNIFATLSQALTASPTLLRARPCALIYGFPLDDAREGCLFFPRLNFRTNSDAR